MEVSDQLHTPIVPQGKNLRYPLKMKLVEYQVRYGHGVEEKNSQPLEGLESPIIHPVAQHYTTELSRLIMGKRLILIVIITK
jgi:hypothetical protein